MGGGAEGRSPDWLGMGLTISAAILWGSTYPVIQLGLGYYNAFQISFLRAIFATASLLLYFSSARKRRIQLLHIPRDRSALLLFLAASMFGAVGFWTLLNLSVLFLAANTSSFLVALYPLIALVFASLILGEKLTVRRALGVGLGIFGIYVIVGIGAQAQLTGSQPLEGALIALGAAFSWACYMTATKVLMGRRDRTSGFVYTPEYVTFSTFAISVLPTLAIALLAGDWERMLNAPASGLAIVLYLGVLTSSLAFLIFNRGMEMIGVSRAAINQLLFPPVAVILSYFLLGQTVSLTNALGIALILLGVWVAQR